GGLRQRRLLVEGGRRGAEQRDDPVAARVDDQVEAAAVALDRGERGGARRERDLDRVEVGERDRRGRGGPVALARLEVEGEAEAIVSESGHAGALEEALEADLARAGVGADRALDRERLRVELAEAELEPRVAGV